MSPPGATPSAARVITVAITAAVEAARAGQLAAFTEASTRLSTMDVERVGIVQSAAIRSLLENLHPDGLDADDVRAVLLRITHSAGWFPAFDVDALLTVFTGALGMSDPDEAPTRFSRGALSQHASLVVADLVTTSHTHLAAHLEIAVAEIQRAETMELP